MDSPSSSHDWTIEGSQGQPVFGTTDLPQSNPVAALIICHGFKGYKDYGLFPFLARHAAALGMVAHRFNFSHSGMTRNIETFERPDLFEKDTYSKQIEDLVTVVAASSAGQLPGPASLPTIWFGHSRGGVAVVLTAARSFVPDAYTFPSLDQPIESPRAVISAAAPHRAVNWDEQVRQQVRSQGYLDSPSSRTGQNLRVGRLWLDELEQYPQEFDPVAAVKRIDCPVLVIHGDNDQTVGESSATALAEVSDKVTLELVGGASHTFNAPNPLSQQGDIPQETIQLVDLSCRFAIDSVN